MKDAAAHLTLTLLLLVGAGCRREDRKRPPAKLPPLIQAANIEPSAQAPSPAFFKALERVSTVDAGLERLPDGRFLYSAAQNGRYGLRLFDPVSRTHQALQVSPFADQLFASFFGTSLLSLRDRLGDRKFQVVASSGIAPRPSSCPAGLSRMFSSPLGRSLVLISKSDRRKRREQARVVTQTGPTETLELEGLYQGHAFSSDETLFLIGSDRGLWIWDLRGGGPRLVAERIAGEKVSPVFDERRGLIYFTASGPSGFREIYSLAYGRDGGRLRVSDEPKPLYISRHDKNRLTAAGNSLFFVEDVDSGFELKELDLRGGKAVSLTRAGVVYSYRLQPERPDAIIAVRADLDGPSGLIEVDRKTRRSTPITPREPGLRCEAPRLARRAGSAVAAWRFDPRGRARGLVLSLHGGPDVNVSPRWDPFFQLWLEAGLAVVAPNYPASRGWGTRYMNAGRDESLADLRGWIDALAAEDPARPIFLEGLSYGGGLAQELALGEGGRVAGLIVRSSAPDPRLLAAPNAPPALYLLGARDPIVPAKPALRALLTAASARPGRLFYRVYGREGHLTVEAQALADSLSTSAGFLGRLLPAKTAAGPTPIPRGAAPPGR